MLPHDVTVTELDDGVVRLAFRSDHQQNLLTVGLLRDLRDAVGDLKASPPQVLIIAGGERAFTGGAFIEELTTLDRDEFISLVELELGLFRTLEQLPCVTVAAVRGACIGNGVELALSCDLRIAADDLKLGIPEVRLGYPAPVQRLCRFVALGAVKELVLSGRIVYADEALRLGLVTRVVPVDRFDDAVASEAANYRHFAPTAVSATKRLIDRAAMLDLDLSGAILADTAAALDGAT